MEDDIFWKEIGFDSKFEYLCFMNLNSDNSIKSTVIFLDSLYDDIEVFTKYYKDFISLKLNTFNFPINLDIRDLFIDRIEKYIKLELVRKSYKRRRIKASIEVSKKKHIVFKYYGKICLCCGTSKNITIDHVIPVSKNGSNKISNLQPLCRSCNSRKRTNTTDYRLKIKNN